MAVTHSVRVLFQTLLSSAALVLVPLLLQAKPVQAQLRDPASLTPPPEQTQELNQLRPLNQATNKLSIASGQKLMAEASAAIANQDYAQAASKLQDASAAFNQMSTFYQQLSATFLGVDTRLHESNRQKALETAQLRDQANYQLALVYRAQNDPDQAVESLMGVLRSQQPTRDLGQRAFQQLFELGFVDEVYTAQTKPAPGDSAAPTPPPEQTPELSQRPLNQAIGKLSIPTGKRLMEEASAAVASQDYAQAASKLQDARTAFNQMSTFYQELSDMFQGVDTRLNQSNRQRALEAAQLRDQATYQLALVYRAQNNPDQAVERLMEVIQSQQPTRNLGQRAYQQLFELGFVPEAYAGRAASTPSPR